MQGISQHYAKVKTGYDSGGSPLGEIGLLTERCLRKLNDGALIAHQGNMDGKRYSVFRTKSEESRPFLLGELICDPTKYAHNWAKVLARAGDSKTACSPVLLNRLLYTAVTAFSCCFDLWKRGSRKTPGTFYEVLIGSVMAQLLPGWSRSKHISIPESDESVSTDIVFSRPGAVGGIAVPVKITTRERIVQPYAHQRILDGVFGEGVFASVLICVSELQLTTGGVKEICVPGAIKLFQKHLSRLSAICYLDPPARYLKADVTSQVPVYVLGDFLTRQLQQLTR